MTEDDYINVAAITKTRIAQGIVKELGGYSDDDEDDLKQALISLNRIESRYAKKIK